MKYMWLLFSWILLVILMITINTLPSLIRDTRNLDFYQLEKVQQRQNNASIPVIYAITPTFSRAVQKAELTRLANTFRHVPQFHWIVVEDSDSQTELVSRFLARSGMQYTHLNVPTPQMFKGGKKPKGTEQRNAALRWLRGNCTSEDEGVVFFADDDNTYSLELFEEMRSTRRVAVWPVGLVAGQRYERPLVENGKVVGWYTDWWGGRPFAINMAGFAVNLQVILSNPHALFKRIGAVPAMQESDFLQLITKVEDLEPKARNCTQVLVWHTRTVRINPDYEPKDSVFIEI